MTTLHQDLNSLFKQLNEQLFDGRLPPYEAVWEYTEGDTVLGECHRDSGLIRIHPKLKEDLENARCTLIHEMIHHWFDGHGEEFQGELMRLATEKGETWARAEAEGYGSNAQEANDFILDRVGRYIEECKANGDKISGNKIMNIATDAGACSDSSIRNNAKLQVAIQQLIDD